MLRKVLESSTTSMDKIQGSTSSMVKITPQRAAKEAKGARY